MSDIPRYPPLRRSVPPSEALPLTIGILLRAKAELDASGSPRPLTSDELAVIAAEFNQLRSEQRQVEADHDEDKKLVENYWHAVELWEQEQRELADLIARQKELEELRDSKDRAKKERAAELVRLRTARKRSTNEHAKSLGLGGIGMALLALLMSDRKISFVIIVRVPG